MTVPPRTDGDGSLRGNLRKAQGLLAACGLDGARRRAAQRRRPGPGAGIHGQQRRRPAHRGALAAQSAKSWASRCKYRAVDFALYQQRLQKFDFDITSIAYQGTNNPGQEFADLFGSAAADQEDSGNFPGREKPGGRCLHRRHGRRPDAGATAARLPCAGACDCPRPLPDSAVVGQHAPHGLQRLAPGAARP